MAGNSRGKGIAEGIVALIFEVECFANLLRAQDFCT